MSLRLGTKITNRNTFLLAAFSEVNSITWNCASRSWGGSLQSHWILLLAHCLLRAGGEGMDTSKTKPTKSLNKKPTNQTKTTKKEHQKKKAGEMAYSLFYSLHIHTYLFFIWDAHDLHCLHGLLKHVFVLLTWDRDMPIGKEAVFVVRLQQQIILGKNWQRSCYGFFFFKQTTSYHQYQISD